MKKVLTGLILSLMPLTAYAQINPTVQPSSLPGQTDLGALLTAIINWFLGLVGLLAVVMLIIGGFRYLTSMGNEQSVEKAKHTIMYALIGIIIVILSYAIVYTITSSLQSLG